MSIIQTIKDWFKPKPAPIEGKLLGVAIVNNKLGVVREIEENGVVMHIFVELKDDV